jgi:hypothetical protein
MQVRLTLLPGQNGTRQLTRKYGNRLICVRYRYDEATRRRYKTIELIESTSPWPADASTPLPVEKPRMPRSPAPAQPEGTGHDKHRTLVNIDFDELELRQKAQKAGGFWVKKEKAWSIPSTQVPILGLSDRVKK